MRISMKKHSKHLPVTEPNRRCRSQQVKLLVICSLRFARISSDMNQGECSPTNPALCRILNYRLGLPKRRGRTL